MMANGSRHTSGNSESTIYPKSENPHSLNLILYHYCWLCLLFSFECTIYYCG